MRIGFFTLLAILFIALKLTNVIDWSWWYVMMPFYLPTSIYIVLHTFLEYQNRKLAKIIKEREDKRPKHSFQIKLDSMIQEAREKQNLKK